VDPITSWETQKNAAARKGRGFDPANPKENSRVDDSIKEEVTQASLEGKHQAGKGRKMVPDEKKVGERKTGMGQKKIS